MLRSVRSAPDAAAAPPAAVTLASWPERAVLLDEPLDALAQGRWRSGCWGGAVPEHRLSTADHLSGLKHGVTKATRTHGREHCRTARREPGHTRPRTLRRDCVLG